MRSLYISGVAISTPARAAATPPAVMTVLFRKFLRVTLSDMFHLLLDFSFVALARRKNVRRDDRHTVFVVFPTRSSLFPHRINHGLPSFPSQAALPRSKPPGESSQRFYS
jgi:hypothetical protein